jgi:hypothetical protein
VPSLKRESDLQTGLIGKPNQLAAVVAGMSGQPGGANATAHDRVRRASERGVSAVRSRPRSSQIPSATRKIPITIVT